MFASFGDITLLTRILVQSRRSLNKTSPGNIKLYQFNKIRRTNCCRTSN